MRSSFIATTAVALAVLLGVASVARLCLSLESLYVWKALALFVTLLLLAVGSLAANHPFTHFGPANQTTTVRALLVALVAGFVGENGSPGAAAAAAGLTLAITGLDGLDGWLARRTRMASDFGARFDMEVDALLVMILSILAWQFGKAGSWVLLSGLLRYGFLVAGWLRPWLARPLPPSRRRQLVCVVQIGGLNLAIIPAIHAPVSVPVAAVALAALVYSFTIDVVWLWRHAA
ncbi:MAG: CDP-alcohol phosphatidyltransferase family protein [Acidobacteriota bacterium]